MFHSSTGSRLPCPACRPNDSNQGPHQSPNSVDFNSIWKKMIQSLDSSLKRTTAASKDLNDLCNLKLGLLRLVPTATSTTFKPASFKGETVTVASFGNYSKRGVKTGSAKKLWLQDLAVYLGLRSDAKSTSAVPMGTAWGCGPAPEAPPLAASWRKTVTTMGKQSSARISAAFPST